MGKLATGGFFGELGSDREIANMGGQYHVSAPNLLG